MNVLRRDLFLLSSNIIKTRNTILARLRDVALCKYMHFIFKREKCQFWWKNKNLPNVPQVGPIEKFSAKLKKKYSERGNSAKSLASFKRICKNLEEQF